jgi:hypothetical protein
MMLDHSLKGAHQIDHQAESNVFHTCPGSTALVLVIKY